MLMAALVPILPVPANATEPTTTQHGVIKLNNGIELQSFAGTTGDGSVDYPYIIENYIIDAHGSGSGIYVGNTTAYLTIRNCEVYGAANIDGSYRCGGAITVLNTVHVTVENCYCHDSYSGICFTSNPTTGGCDGNTALNNRCDKNTDKGIFVFAYDGTCNNNIISYNTCTNDHCGICLQTYWPSTGGCSHNTITNNNCSDSNNGITLQSTVVSNNIVSNNSCVRLKGEDIATVYGISLSSTSDSDYNTITNNTCSQMVGRGVYFSGSSGGAAYGISHSCYSGSNNVISYNHCSDMCGGDGGGPGGKAYGIYQSFNTGSNNIISHNNCNDIGGGSGGDGGYAYGTTRSLLLETTTPYRTTTAATLVVGWVHQPHRAGTPLGSA